MENNFSVLGSKIWDKIKTKMSIIEHQNAWKLYFENENLNLEDVKKDFIATKSNISSYIIPKLKMVSGGDLNSFIKAFLDKTVDDSKLLNEFLGYLIVNYSNLIEELLSNKRFHLIRPAPTLLLQNYPQYFDLESYFSWYIGFGLLGDKNSKFALRQLPLYIDEMFSHVLSSDLVSLFFKALAKGMVLSDEFFRKIKEGETQFQYYSLFKEAIEEYYDYKLITDDLRDFCNSRIEYRNIVSFLKEICDDEGFVLLVRLSDSLCES